MAVMFGALFSAHDRRLLMRFRFPLFLTVFAGILAVAVASGCHMIPVHEIRADVQAVTSEYTAYVLANKGAHEQWRRLLLWRAENLNDAMARAGAWISPKKIKDDISLIHLAYVGFVEGDSKLTASEKSERIERSTALRDRVHTAYWNSWSSQDYERAKAIREGRLIELRIRPDIYSRYRYRRR